jgi:NitT/TauT family transport system substrate-binding protein/putative hydroxymethylpyrimidine transport system substrate-binding protein
VTRLALLAVVLAALLAGCGGDDAPAGAPGKPSRLVLALDFTPNAVHAPLYMAVDRRRDVAHGLRLEIRQPGSGPDALKLVGSGRADLGILDIHDLAIARQQGSDLVAIGALVQRPLAALAARPAIHRPRDLEGRTVGVSGLPSDPAFVKAIVEHDGGDATKVKEVTIGFSAVTRILSGRVDAAPVFWNAEGVALRRAGLAVREFRVDDYGAPRYPEVVIFTSRRTLTHRRGLLRAALAAIADGVRAVQADPVHAVELVAAAARTKDTGLVRAQLDAVAPAFLPPLRLDRAVLEAWADFDARVGIVRERPDVARAFDFSLVKAGGD